MKARARFYARGQSDQDRGIQFAPWLQASWPQWARDAYRKGFHDTPLSRSRYPALWGWIEGNHLQGVAFQIPDFRGKFPPSCWREGTAHQWQ